MATLIGGVPSDATDWSWIIGRSIAIELRAKAQYSFYYWNRPSATPMRSLSRANAPGGLPTDGSQPNNCCPAGAAGASGLKFPPGVNVEPDATATCMDVLGTVPIATDPNLGESWCE